MRWPLPIALLILTSGSACKTDTSTPDLDQLKLLAAKQEQSIAAVAVRAKKLSAEWDDVHRALVSAEKASSAARLRYEAVAKEANTASGTFVEASERWKEAAEEWRFFQQLTLVAAAIDARNLDAYREWRGGRATDKQFSCDSVSTSQFREGLIALGVNLSGKDVDHIVPRSLGGADHPSNYQLLDSSLNRSLGNAWGRDKCRMTGEARCAEAIAVSRKCGSYGGPLRP